MFVIEEASFKNFIKEELTKVDSSLSFQVKDYLGDLLDFYLLSDRLFEYRDYQGNFYEEAFVSLYQKVQDADRNRKIYLFKRMGDLSLYLSGFFRPSLEKKGIHPTYYENIGKSAYSRIADLYPLDEKNIFKFLCLEFETLTEVLSCIQSRTNFKNQIENLDIPERDLIKDKKSI